MMYDWQQKRMEEERLIKQYENPSEGKDVKNLHFNNPEILELNKKFYDDIDITTNSVSDSIKYLMKKKKRESQMISEESKSSGREIKVKVEIQKLPKIEKNLKFQKPENNNLNNNFNNNLNNFHNKKLLELEDEPDIDKEELENELFKFDY